MNVEIFVQNVKHYCKLKETTPTVACDESGAGRNFMDNIKKGSIPSVAKVQLLANYLGVTTSELLGEDVTRQVNATAQPDLVIKFNSLSSDDQDEVLAIIEMKLARKPQK